MHVQHEPRKLTIITAIIILFVPLALASCSYFPWHKSDPWYTAYDINSRADLFSVASVPSLVRALQDEKVEVRLEALKTLAKIGIDAKDAEPALMETAVKDSDEDVRQAAATTLERIELKGESGNKETAANKVESEHIRKVKVLIQTVRLGSRDWMVQREAVNQLADMGPGVADAIPALIRVVEDKSNKAQGYNEVIRGAVKVLGNIGPEARTANPALIRLMASKDFAVRRQVVQAMGKIGPLSDPSIIEALTLALHGDPELIGIRHGFSHLLPASKEQMAYKGIIYGDPNGDIRRDAANALGKFGAAALSAVPALEDASLNDIDYDVRREAVAALCKIQPDGDAAMTALDKAIGDKKPSARAAAVLALQKVKPENREAFVPKIIACLDDLDENVRMGAVKTLAEYKIGKEAIFNALQRVALEDKSLTVKQEAVKALNSLKNE